MKRRQLPPQEELLSRLRYEPETGKLYWRPLDVIRHWTDKSWNTRFAGGEAFTSVNSSGYRLGGVSNGLFLAHRIIWKMMTGEDPDQIDHINGDRLDNRFSNLRDVPHDENVQNQRVYKSNKSGHHGVELTKHGLWRVRIGDNGRRVQLGYFKTKEEAIRARQEAERKLGYHKNHGV